MIWRCPGVDLLCITKHVAATLDSWMAFFGILISSPMADFLVYVGNSTSDLSLTKSVERPRPEPAKTTIDPPEYPPKPSEPYFIVPPGFRSNTFFVGMEKELQNLDKRLFDKRRRAAGTSCVLLHGQAGTGKSHLARQYVYQKRDKFKGGVFWIDARLKEEVYQSFWIIAQKVVARDSPELRSPINSEKKPFVEVVKDWFENRHDWLMVFDGVALDKDEDASQLQQFIPDSTNSSLIYVSRAQNLETKQRLLRPFPIKVSPLKDDDARKLLFKELHIKKPSESDKKRALELVKKMGGLPLAIHAISHRLADTHEPLKNYTMKSYSADPKLGATYNQIMDDLQRGNHMEAWNLINILCFFGPNIPVEMVNMGLSALRFCDVDVESTDGGKPDINITFATLMRYALIERNEPVDSDSSSSRDSLVDPEPIDMLKIHRVVQNFCCDALNAAHLLPRCLEYATSLFIHSFRQADLKIKKRPEPGRVSDYRAYLIHGQKLWDNSLHYENRNQPLNDVRHDLGPWLDNINEEIRLREPSSSQESVENTTVFQTSVFDRASNSSDSLPSDLGMPDQGILTPKHRPTPLPLPHQNPFGIELGKPAMDSPRSIGTNSPTAYPRIVDHSPRAQYPPLYPYYSTGYTSDREDMPRSQPMNQSVSEATARPHVPSIPSHGEDWQVVPSSRKLRKPRYQKNLGNFRPAGATTLLDKDQATGSVTRQAPKSRGELSGSSDAVTSLAAVHHASPPPSRGGGSIWPRRSSSRPAALSIDRPTYAGVLAGETSQPAFSHQGPPNSSTGPHSRAVDTSPIQNWDPSREAFHGPSDDLQMPPLTRATPSTMNEYSQYQPPPATSRLGVAPGSSKSSPGMQHVQSQPGSSTNLSRIALQQSSSENTVPTYHQTLITGPNPAPLPFESDIIISTKRPYPSDSRTAYQRSTSSNQSHSSFSPTFPFTTAIPPGYTSQPTSRNPSHISHLSEPATEPPRPSHPMSFSPHLSSASVSHSPRDRLPDGSSPRKSPRVSYAYPVPPPGHEEYIISPSSQTSGVLSGTGGWAAVPRAFNEHHSPLSQHSPLSRSTSMSRSGSGGGGSRGAGVVVDEDRGLGIAEFGAEVVFGELEPVRLEEARSRTRAWEEELRGRSRDGRIGGGRARSGDAGVPYPDVNLIPTESDRMVLDGMVGERGRR